jgi:predicted transcriptional regulator
VIIREELYRIADKLALNASIDDVIDRLVTTYKVEMGIKQADEGNVILHDDVEQQVEKWLK